MRINIDLNEKHIATIMKHTGLTSKSDVVNAALKHYVEQHEKRIKESLAENDKTKKPK